LAAVKINPADVDIIANELEVRTQTFILLSSCLVQLLLTSLQYICLYAVCSWTRM